VARLLESDIWHPETQSELERQALGLFRRFRLPRPQCQYDVIEENRRLAVVDFAWPRVKVIVEAEGFQFHSGREAWESDIARYNALAVHGWTVLRLTHSDLQGGAEAFASSVGRAIAARGPRHRARQFAH
jgi:very-short-patch-repair endonuclease